jgi:LacI family transcriptional regulator
MKVTIDEVARKAGVSRATVDRVINQRGRVRGETVERVLGAMRSTRYLNEVSSQQGQGNSYRFDFVLPIARTRYFEYFSKEIQTSENIFALMQADVHVHTVPGFDPQALADKLIEVGEESDGIAFVALDHPLVRAAVKTLRARDLGVISLISDVSYSERLAYVGIDNRAAGRTAGLLTGRFLGRPEHGEVAVFLGSHRYRGHEEREAGFKSMIRERFGQLTIVERPEVLDDDERSYLIASELLSAHPHLLGIYNIGGGTSGISRALQEKQGGKHVVFIAHELNASTRKLMLEGWVDAIINQDIRQEVYAVVEMLLNHNEGRPVNQGIQMPKVEIFMSENTY